ncbi:MAG: Rnf-Nqr domain containing protein [Oscillospiraceae bacterium]
MKADNLRRYRRFCNVTGGLFSDNIVLVYGVAISIIIGAATSGKSALALSIAMLFTLVPTMIISSLLSEKIDYTAQIAITFLVSMICLIPSSYVVKLINPAIFETLGIYFPLVATNSAIIVKSNQYKHSKKPLYALTDGIISSIGFLIVAIIIGIIREYFASGTIFEHQLSIPIKITAMKMSFAGFIVLAFVTAGANALNRLIKTVIFKVENK